MSEQVLMKEPYCDPIIKRQLMKIRERVLKKDRDFVVVYDGEEGSGKSVLAMQHARILDPNFNLNQLVFTSDDFISLIKNPNTKKGTCVILDEAYNAASARASLTEVNRSMIGLATEMRQKNLFVILVLPTFFDLDRYFAIWRCKALFHVYFAERSDDRRYIVFDFKSKKKLYLNGKKTYSYSKPKAPFPPATFFDTYIVDEMQYRIKKGSAFQKRTISNQARNWLLQRNVLIKEIVQKFGLNQMQINQIFIDRNIQPLSPAQISFVMNEIVKEGGELQPIEVPA
jgi:hypothetical protein